ncbi:UPF0256 protein [Streptomyces mashuensis]|uniref:UPF0256 protein n=1 Tax=Streptomyces mashuensis TaxID=33904 RepID=A0A919B485_9ACTN|nr:GNAT family N-acetyltransferase [Streptomyces mashuensis]GHF45818.1 UPF0256 protein [Streptomyces mashuensis]
MSAQIRTVEEPDVPNWMRAVRTGFLIPSPVTKEDVEIRRPGMDLDRTLGAFDAGRCVATLRSFSQQLTVPGGASITADAISAVTVSPTHRRRGLLSGMIGQDLLAAKERGDTAATLIAAEYPIYGRYGFGPATSATEWEVDIARAGLGRRHAGPGDGGRLDFADDADVRELGPGLHERVRAQRHGVIDRSTRWWAFATGELTDTTSPRRERFTVLYRSAAGSVDGLLTYSVDSTWESKQPRCSAAVSDLLAVDVQAERALWHYLLSVDWLTRFTSGMRAPDDLLPLLLPDPRAARVVTQGDYLWLRPLDVPALLAARTYATEGSLVLDVTDPLGLAGGRFLLDAGPDGAHCAPTARPADLTLTVDALGSLSLGDESAARLAALGRVEEKRPGAAARADLLLRTARRPWCPDLF